MDAIAFRTRGRTKTQAPEANCTRRAGGNTACSGRKTRKRNRRSLPTRRRGRRDKEDSSINHTSDEPYDTGDEEASGHQPPPSPRDPLGPASSSSDVVIVAEVERNDQDVVTSSAPKRRCVEADSRLAAKGPTGAPAPAPADSSDDLDDDEELRIVGVVGQVVTRDLPHPRPDCAEHRFTPGCAESNKKYCDQCYCYVCDCKASECEFWGTGQRDRDHSNARPHGFWNRLRLAARAGDKAQVRAEFTATGPLTSAAPRGAAGPGGLVPPGDPPGGSLLAAGGLLPLMQLSRQQPRGGGAGASGSGFGTLGESLEADVDTFMAALGRLRASVMPSRGDGGGAGGGAGGRNGAGGGIGNGRGGDGTRAVADTSGGGWGPGPGQPAAAASSTAVQQQRAPQAGSAVANTGRSLASLVTSWGLGPPPLSLAPLYPCYTYMGQRYPHQPPQYQQPWQTQQPAVQPQPQLQPPSPLPPPPWRSQLLQLLQQQPEQRPNWQSQQQLAQQPPAPPHPLIGNAQQQAQQQQPQQPQQPHPSAVQPQPTHPPPPACSLPPPQPPYRYWNAPQPAQQLQPPPAPAHPLQSPQQSGQIAGGYCHQSQWHPPPPWQLVAAPLLPAAPATGSLSAEGQGHSNWRPASAPVWQPLAGGCGGGGGGSTTPPTGGLPTVFSMRTLSPP